MPVGLKYFLIKVFIYLFQSVNFIQVELAELCDTRWQEVFWCKYALWTEDPNLANSYPQDLT